MRDNDIQQYMLPLVSAVIITHNRLELLKKSIDSVLKQSYPNMECIVVDDASADGTYEYLSTLNNIKYIRIPKEDSKGGNHARNLGINASGGEWIAFLDDDDQWTTDKIAKQIDILRNDSTDICYCGLIKVDNQGKEISKSRVENFKDGDLSKDILRGVICVTSSLIIKKELLVKYAGFDEKLKFWQEYDLCIRLFQNNKVSVLRECSVIYLVNVKDKNRLTNKVVEWEEMLPYFEAKHHVLFQALNDEDSQKHKMFITSDGIRRCHLANDNKKLRKYLYDRYQQTKSIKDFVKYLINYDKRFRC